MQEIRIGVVIPAGPGDDVVDTLESVLAYTDHSRVIVVVDDTDGQLGVPGHPDVHVIPAPPAARGGMGGLWVKIAHGYRWLLDGHQPQLVLRLDADALMLGPGIEAQAEHRFSEHRHVGLLGSYRVAADGGERDFSWAAAQLRREMGWRGFLARRPAHRVFHDLYPLARRHGYIDGHHPLGGAYIHSGQAANAIHDRGWFVLPGIARSHWGEDQIMALVTVAAGYAIGDFGAPGDPLALRWRGLPASPSTLLSRGSLVTHSVRSWDHMTERDIRGYFAEHRRAR